MDLPSIDFGHQEIRQHQVERPRLDQPQGRLAVAGFFHLKVFSFEPASNNPAQRRLVVDHQHPALSPDWPMTGTQIRFHRLEDEQQLRGSMSLMLSVWFGCSTKG